MLISVSGDIAEVKEKMQDLLLLLPLSVRTDLASSRVMLELFASAGGPNAEVALVKFCCEVIAIQTKESNRSLGYQRKGP